MLKNSLGKKAQKDPNGYYIIVSTTEGTKTILGLSSFAEALYRVKRYYNNLPNVTMTYILRQGREVYRFSALTGEDTMTQDPFENFTNDLAAQGKAIDQIPTLDGDLQAVFAFANIPFFIRNVREVDGKWGKSLVYDIDVDITSQEYKSSFRKSQLASSYVLWFPQTPGRVDQWKIVLEGKGIIANQVPLAIAKFRKDNGREFYDFRVWQHIHPSDE